MARASRKSVYGFSTKTGLPHWHWPIPGRGDLIALSSGVADGVGLILCGTAGPSQHGRVTATALDVRSGEVRWSRRLEAQAGQGRGALPEVPAAAVVPGRAVLLYGRRLEACDLRTGKPVWSRRIGGTAEPPARGRLAVSGGAVVHVSVDGGRATVSRIGAAEGTVAWESDLPFHGEVGGVRVLHEDPLVLLAEGTGRTGRGRALFAYDEESGEVVGRAALESLGDSVAYSGFGIGGDRPLTATGEVLVARTRVPGQAEDHLTAFGSLGGDVRWRWRSQGLITGLTRSAGTIAVVSRKSGAQVVVHLLNEADGCVAAAYELDAPQAGERGRVHLEGDRLIRVSYLGENDRDELQAFRLCENEAPSAVTVPEETPPQPKARVRGAFLLGLPHTLAESWSVTGRSGTDLDAVGSWCGAEVVVRGTKDVLHAFSTDTGEMVWWRPAPEGGVVVGMSGRAEDGIGLALMSDDDGTRLDRLTFRAIDVRTGDVRWSSTLGFGPRDVPHRGGPAGLITALPGRAVTLDGTRLTARDLRTGEVMWEHPLDAHDMASSAHTRLAADGSDVVRVAVHEGRVTARRFTGAEGTAGEPVDVAYAGRAAGVRVIHHAPLTLLVTGARPSRPEPVIVVFDARGGVANRVPVAAIHAQGLLADTGFGADSRVVATEDALILRTYSKRSGRMSLTAVPRYGGSPLWSRAFDADIGGVLSVDDCIVAIVPDRKGAPFTHLRVLDPLTGDTLGGRGVADREFGLKGRFHRDEDRVIRISAREDLRAKSIQMVRLR
ncbi:outer membrane protein assembly factor BamB family protein [Yinghuangia soli]|uniref:PQQ-binding-like beta-propeller repeat protein n=1 Tax=Yinghuangia soli TaxID=2908204 RepID=A0AA41QAV6_9ACTN|nr:PQQ-binding-like beta-propeller repeat protein [Yinghuangia soli]MCF2533397.1 PQQ-binding-like beta-propeller repeat protein [Yinghuangia soli]